MKNSIKISICLMSIILVCFSLFGCKKNKNLEIEFLPNTNNVFLNELITIYAKDFDSKIGKLTITEDNLIFLEQQLAACIETGLFNINSYYNCKEKKVNFLYSFFEVEQGKILYKQKESYRLIYDPQDEKAIKSGRETGYVKIPDLDVRNELLILVNFYSAYKEFGMALMNANKNFFIDLDHYSFEINSYFQKYVDHIVIK